jgi:hypothetical protein
MSQRKLFWLLLFAFLLSAIAARGEALATSWAIDIKPYRALLVVERWDDPASSLVDHERDGFQPVAALLKSWSVPFDILRLDQQHLDASYLFDRLGHIRYGVVIWLADSPSYAGQNLASLTEAVNAGTSLLVTNSRFLDPALESLLGVKFKETYTATDPLRVNEPHFITRELAGQKMDPLNVSWDFSNRLWVEPRGAQVLIDQERHPVVTVNRPAAETPAIWIGVQTLTSLVDSVYWRSLFFRSLVWSLGYIVLPNVDYSRRVVLEIDDWGTSDKGFLSYWRYPIPSEETIRRQLIAPLEKRRAVVTANVVTGYVDRDSKRILSPWTQRFTDRYEVQQDYGSTQRGLKVAVAAGVLEIHSHGWTHMQPDLNSPPGPWWTADLTGEASAGGWYTEFEDQRRKTEIPAIVQLVHMKRSLQYLQEDFGHRPLSLRPGGSGWSKSSVNHTGRLAAQAGFGLFHAGPRFYYLDRDLVLDMAGIGPEVGASYDRPLQAERWPAHPDGPVILTFHDRDIALQPGFLDRLFASLPAGIETLSLNQYIGFLHTHIDSLAADGWQLSFNFDEPYCAYFGNHSSSWRLWLADPLLEKLRAMPEVNISIDNGSPAKVKAGDLLRQPLLIDIPTGMGRHVWKLGPVR